MEPSIRILLVDDHDIVRQGLRALLQNVAGMSVVGEAGDGVTALRQVRRLKPDVVVVDLLMPGLGGLEVTRQVTHRFPRTRVVVLSMYTSEAHVLEALRNGAHAYVVKGAQPKDLVHAIREAACGRHYLSTPHSGKPPESYLRKARQASGDPYNTLTTREREVLHLVAEGRTAVDVAKRLGISPRTAEAHRAKVLHKLGLKGQSELIRYALRRGLVPLDSIEGPESEPST